MHLGVVKVGLLQLAKLEVISLCIILAKTKNLTLGNFSSNFDNPYCWFGLVLIISAVPKFIACDVVIINGIPSICMIDCDGDVNMFCEQFIWQIVKW